MCRIAGIISYDFNDLSSNIDRMTYAMRRGGPDDSGIFIDDKFPLAFGHRRLSILDLSEAGHQPMHDVNNRFVISFNGEIYNYLNLKQELLAKGYQFKSNSDTEVILNGYEEWGIDILKKLNGMFAFLLYDKKRKKVFAARDSVGIKPLYYSFYGGKMYFSSEVRGFKSVNPNWPENPDWGIWFLTFGFMPEPHTTLEKVQHLPKGHYLEYDLIESNYAVICFYEDNFSVSITEPEQAILHTRNTVIKAVEDHLIADVPVGVFLSGGLDSSIITSIAQNKHKEKLNTISIYFDSEKYSEKKFQDLVVQKTGVIHRSFKVSNEEYQNELPFILEAMDQPTIDGVNSYFISKYANLLGFKVVLSGLGADELFGGYDSFRNKKVDQIRKYKLAASLYSKLKNEYPLKKVEYLQKDRWYNDYLLNRGLFCPSDVSRITGFDIDYVNKKLDTFSEGKIFKGLEKRNKISYLESAIYMQNQLLRDSDVFSMWYGLELRVPFLDLNVIHLARSIEPSIKYNISKKKYLLAEAFKDDLPKEIFNRIKQGFGFPFENWVKENKYLNNTALLPTKWKHEFLSGKVNFFRVWAVFLSRCFLQDSQLEIENPKRVPTILFTYLCAFSATGGIEKVNRSILKVLNENNGTSELSEAISLYDNSIDTRYFNRFRFTGFNKRKLAYLTHFITCDLPWEKVIIGHVNLLPVVWIIKKRNPKIKVILMVHGIEVWHSLNKIQKNILMQVDEVISVSNYTKQKLIELNGFNAEKIIVKPNCLDPFFIKTKQFAKPPYLLKKYGLIGDEKIVLSISRISIQDRYKGYVSVINAIAKVKLEIPKVLFLICGKSTPTEKKYLEGIIENEGVKENVRLVGFLQDDEVQDHYLLADVFAMPSRKEGFGIVFIEAAANGVNVIAGNEDASKEALINGEMGTLLNPDDIPAIANAIKDAFNEPKQKPSLQELVFSVYNFESYKKDFPI